MYIHLKTHSYYSFLRGLASPNQLAQTAAHYNLPYLGLTDFLSLTGAVEFYDSCLNVGIKPILGLELPIIVSNLQLGSTWPSASPITGNITLLSMNLSGWSQLCKLSSILNSQPASSSTPTMNFDILSDHTQGLICLTGGSGGILSPAVNLAEKAANLLLENLSLLYPDRCYVELQANEAIDFQQFKTLNTLARKHDLPTVCTTQVYYITPDQANLQRTISSLRLNRAIDNVPPSEYAPQNSHLADPKQIELLFSEFPDAIENTRVIAERCYFELPVGQLHFPTLPGIQEPPEQIIHQKAYDGAQRIYCDLTAEISNRLEYELAVITRYGYSSLFLIMQDILLYAQENGIPYTSRGSAASSLVAHCLGITTPDPIKLNLYFERFLNPARAKPPDIDTDLCSRRRDEVIQYVYRQYGQNRVAMVATINRFRTRSAIRDVSKAYGLSRSIITELIERLPERWYGQHQTEGQGTQSPFTLLANQYPSEPYLSIFRDAEAILGMPNHLSIHPGGLVIAAGELSDLVPTLVAAKGITITQFDLDSIERLGLIKIDLLGIRGLTVLGDVELSMKFSPLSDSKGTVESLEDIPEDDPQTANLVKMGRTIGCFQIESPGMRLTLRELQAQSIEDIMAALALYRPGPLTGGQKDEFILRYRNRSDRNQQINYLHPSLESVLTESYGVILYQEQVLRIAHELAGLSLADADLLRRAMSHFDPGKQMQTLKERFIAGAHTRHEVPVEIAERVWEMMAAFAGYGFPKAHAASYAQVAWRSAWCKAHFPATFMASVMANWGGYYSQRVYMTEARRLGLSIRPPHINYSRLEFSVAEIDNTPVLFMGLDQVRELTRRTQNRILQQRPFHSLQDFIKRADPKPIELENLIKVSALEGLGTIPVLLYEMSHPKISSNQLLLFSMDYDTITTSRPLDDWSTEEKVSAQEAILGTGVIAHPLELLSSKITGVGSLSTVSAASRIGDSVIVAGMRQTWRRSRTYRGEYIYFLALEDLEGMLDVIISQNVYQRYRSELSNQGPYVIEGVVENDPTTLESILRAERIVNLTK